jgi:hypothetical protein
MRDDPGIHLPRPWPEFLVNIDAALLEPVEVHCMGGFALIAAYNFPRATGDLDYLATIPKEVSPILEELGGPGSKLAIKHRVCVQRVGIADLPDDYASRLAELDLGMKNLRLFVLDPYDLVLSKLTRNSPKDREDVKYLAQTFLLESSALHQRFEQEMKPWLPNLARHELTLKLWSEYFSRKR